MPKGKRIMREKRTQKSVAETICTGQAFVSLFLAGFKNCSVDTARLLAEHYGKTPEWWVKSTSNQRQKQLGLARRRWKP